MKVKSTSVNLKSASVNLNAPSPKESDLKLALQKCYDEIDCYKEKINKLNNMLHAKNQALKSAQGLVTQFKNINAELLKKIRWDESQGVQMQVDSASCDWEPRVAAIERELVQLRSALNGPKGGKVVLSGIRVENPRPSWSNMKQLLRGLRNGALQPRNLASRFSQTSKKCEGRVGHNYMSRNIVSSHRAMTRSFGIRNSPSKINIFDKAGNLVARGFKRFANSDHGPYLEVNPSDIYWEGLELRNPRGKSPFFLDFRTKSSMRVYYQVRTVESQPYPPRSQNDCFNVRQPGGRAGGYADYKPDMCYLDARKIIIQGKALQFPSEPKPMQVDQPPLSNNRPPRRPGINGFNIRPHRQVSSATGTYAAAAQNLPPGLWRVNDSGVITREAYPNFQSPNFYRALAEPNGGPPGM